VSRLCPDGLVLQVLDGLVEVGGVVLLAPELEIGGIAAHASRVVRPQIGQGLAEVEDPGSPASAALNRAADADGGGG